MSCLYDSLSAFNEIRSADLRTKICNYLESNPGIAGAYAQEFVQWETGMDLKSYISRMRRDAWGGAVEIKAFCDMYETNVRVKVPMNKREIEFLSDKPTKKWVCIQWTGNHFVPLP